MPQEGNVGEVRGRQRADDREEVPSNTLPINLQCRVLYQFRRLRWLLHSGI